MKIEIERAGELSKKFTDSQASKFELLNLKLDFVLLKANLGKILTEDGN